MIRRTCFCLDFMTVRFSHGLHDVKKPSGKKLRILARCYD